MNGRQQPAGRLAAAADRSRLSRYQQAAAGVRDQIADGTLKPGSLAPSGAALSRATGYSALTCRKAVRLLIHDGVLVPGPTRNARPRVTGPLMLPQKQALADAAREMSGGLAARRRAAGLTQQELAAVAGVSVTTIGHAETGRLWQSRKFWERVDAALRAGGRLLLLHDAYRAAAGAGQDRWQQPEPAGPAPPAVPEPTEPACVIIVWGNGRVTTVRPPLAPCLPGPAGLTLGATCVGSPHPMPHGQEP